MHSTIAPIAHRISQWAGVETDPTHDGVTFRIDDRELARLSARGDLAVPTTPALRDQLLTDGFADGVPGRHDQVQYRVRSPADVAGAIRLLRVAYLSGSVMHTPPVGRDDHLRRLDGSSELVALLVGADTADHDRQTA